jgi:radical SAM superfamily enzyme YgiQ (UPF0313 family)
MRILLVSSQSRVYNNKTGSYKKTVTYPSLTLVTLAGLVPSELDAEIKILDEGVDDTPIDYSVDIIAISAMTATTNRAYEIANKARKRGVYVVLGGYHISYNYEEAKRYADTVIIGQADATWPQFLRDFSAGHPKKKYCQDGPPNVVNLPFPRWGLLKWNKYLKITTIQASRGCPNSCKYCNVSDNMFPGNNRPIEDVISEIKHFKSKKIAFLDPNFFANREYAIKLVTELIPLKIKWACLSTIKVGGDIEMLELLKRSGCIGVLVGLETVCQDNIKGMNKPENKVDQYKEYLNNFHNYGISVLACFVLGFDNDDKNTFKKTVEFIKEANINLIRFSALTPFPGTPLYKELEKNDRIISKDWDLYDFQNIVYQPKQLTVKELEDGLIYCWDEIYSLKEIFKRTLKAKNHRLLIFALNIGFRKMYKGYFKQYSK